MRKPVKKPTPVTIADDVVPVKMVEGEKEKKLVEKQKGGTALAPNTTEEEDITTAGQRRVNLIWEYTQAVIAIIVVFTAMFSAVWVVVVDRVIKVIPADASLASAWTIIATAIGLVVGFYFSRTNHAAIGGVGKQPSQKYEGR